MNEKLEGKLDSASEMNTTSVEDDGERADAQMVDQASDETVARESAQAKSQAHASVAEHKSAPNPHESVTVVQDPNDPDKVIIRTRKRERKKSTKKRKNGMNPKLRVFLIIVAVIVGLLAAVGIALAIAVNMGNVNLHKMLTGLDNTPQEATVKDQGQTVEYNGHTYKYNENVISFVAIGRDDESNYANVTRKDATCADAIILFAIDTSTKKIRAIMVPRNSWVPVDLYESDQSYVGTRDLQITLSHAVLLDSIDKCAANTTKSVSYLFYNLPITYFIDVDFDVVKNASTAVGGVQLEALHAIPGASYAPGDTVILMGDEALRYVRYRDVDVFESAVDRQERQVQFVKAFAAKLSNLGAQDVLGLYNGVSENVVTNLGMSEIAYLAYCFSTGGSSGFELTTLTGTTEVVAEADGEEYERYYLDSASVMQNTLDAFYTRVD